MSKVIDKARLTVLSTPLARVDRRALSQAWYSALHLNAAEKSGRGHSPKFRSVTSGRSPARPDAERLQRAYVLDSARSFNRTSKPGTSSSVPAERRTLPTALTRKIEQKFLAHLCRSRAATFTLEAKQGRVQIILRAEGAQVRLIAICSESARGVVSAALRQARYALAAKGVMLEATLQAAS